MTDTGDKSSAELENITRLLETTVEQNEEMLRVMRTGRWKK